MTYKDFHQLISSGLLIKKRFTIFVTWLSNIFEYLLLQYHLIVSPCEDKSLAGCIHTKIEMIIHFLDQNLFAADGTGF